MSDFRLIPIEDLSRRSDTRREDIGATSNLADSIAKVGLTNPITVRVKPDGCFEIIAGSHRYAACDSLGHHEIMCQVVELDDLHAELAMIDENLCRAELSPSDRARQTARRKAIYEELHPEVKQGGAPGLPGGGKAKVDMRLPPERFYPANDGGHAYLRDDAMKTATDWLNGGGTSKRTVSNVYLRADAATSKDIDANRRPSYLMAIETPDANGDGEPEITVAPQRWVMRFASG